MHALFLSAPHSWCIVDDSETDSSPLSDSYYEIANSQRKTSSARASQRSGASHEQTGIGSGPEVGFEEASLCQMSFALRTPRSRFLANFRVANQIRRRSVAGGRRSASHCALPCRASAPLVPVSITFSLVQNSPVTSRSGKTETRRAAELSPSCQSLAGHWKHSAYPSGSRTYICFIP